MRVALLRGENLRLYKQFEIEPDPGLNLIIGDNAAGKTSLLEALYLGSRGKSFRASNLSEACGSEQGQWNVFMELRGEQAGQGGCRVGVGWSKAGTEVRLDGHKQARLADIARAVPMQLLDPQAHKLLEEGPASRRSFIDWGVFHVEQSFLQVWRRTQKALRQRNQVLRAGGSTHEIRAWNGELSQAGEALNRMRSAHVDSIASAFEQATEQLMGQAASLRWQRGWPEDVSLGQVLEDNLEQHQRLETTVQGPHRAELRVSLGSRKAKGRISRGQQKMLITALVLSQAEIMMSSGVSAPILLLDDFESELAPEFQRRLSQALQAYPGQKFVTAFSVPEALQGSAGRMFHVEHGSVSAAGSIH